MQSSKDLQKAKAGMEAFAEAYKSLHCRIKWLEDRNASNHTIIKNLKEGRTVENALAQAVSALGEVTALVQEVAQEVAQK